MRTSNAADGPNQEIKRRTRVVRIFPPAESLLRMVSPFLNENPPSRQHAA